MGGNYASQNRDYELVECEFDNIIHVIKKNNQNAKIYLLECPPRHDVNVGWVNDIIRQVRDNNMVNILNTNEKFLKENRNIDYRLIWRDGIHLTNKGTATLLKHFNETIQVIKDKMNNDRIQEDSKCYTCGESGHNSRSCRHGMTVQCWCCGNIGHKMKNFWFSDY